MEKRKIRAMESALFMFTYGLPFLIKPCCCKSGTLLKGNGRTQRRVVHFLSTARCTAIAAFACSIPDCNAMRPYRYQHALNRQAISYLILITGSCAEPCFRGASTSLGDWFSGLSGAF